MTLTQVIVSALIGYLFGCVQTAYFIGKTVKDIDIRKHGSNNSGASNVTRVLGWKYGIFTAIVDIFKGTLAVWLIGILYPGLSELLFLTGAFVLLGHIFPFFMGFKGGKGTASLIGITLAIDFKIALIITSALVIITLVTDFIAVGSIVMYALLPVMSFFYNYNLTCISICIFIFLVGIYKHIINIKRIVSKEEVGLRAVARKK